MSTALEAVGEGRRAEFTVASYFAEEIEIADTRFATRAVGAESTEVHGGGATLALIGSVYKVGILAKRAVRLTAASSGAALDTVDQDG